LLGTSVAEIHRYPLRPEGFEEPLFPTLESRQAIMEHLLDAPWLRRASELRGCTGEAAHAFEEPVSLESRDGRVSVVRFRAGRRCSWRRRRIIGCLDRWRTVRGWWDEGGIDRLFFRVLLSGDLVAELARERSGGWFLVGVVD